MKALVTGGAGFIGSHVVNLYISQGYEVVVLDDLSTGRVSNLNPAAQFYELDIRSTQLDEIFARERPDFVNHHAAQMDVRRSVAEPLFDADVNILGSLNLIECARRHHVKRFIYVSTGGAVYGEPKYLPCDEAHPVNPICQYGASKHTVEHYLFMYHQNYGLEYCVLRYPNVYGPRQDPQGEAGVVAIFAGQMLADKQVEIYGDGEQQRDFVYVDDCAQANLLALTSPKSSGIYNLGSGHGTSVNELFAMLQALTGYQKPPRHGPARIGETRRIYLDAQRAEGELGWTPATSLTDGLQQTLEYFRSERDAGSPVYRVPEPRGVAERSVPSTDRAKTASLATSLESPLPAEKLSSAARSAGPVDFLQSISVELAEHADLGAFVRRVLQVAVESVGAASGSALVLDNNRHLRRGVVMYAGEVHGDPLSHLDDTLSQGLAGWMAENGEAALLPSTRDDPRWLQRSWDEGDAPTRSAIGVPLIARGEVVGVLTVVHPTANRFTTDDLTLLSTICALVTLIGANVLLPTEPDPEA